MLAGRASEAGQLAQRALVPSRERGERGYEAWAMRLLAEIAAQRDSACPEKTQEQDLEALALAINLAMRPLAAHCHLGLGRLRRRMGRLEQASKHLTTASEMYREMEMKFWPEQAEAEIKALRAA